MSVSRINAVAFDAQWATREIRLCRQRFRQRGFALLPIEDDEVFSIIGLLWTQVAQGAIGRFAGDPEKGSVALQLQGYVARCLDRELIRYLQQDGSPFQVNGIAKYGYVSFTCADNNEEDWLAPADVLEHLVEVQTPETLLEAKQEKEYHPEGWPGPLGLLLDEWVREAREMPLRKALALRACRRVGDNIRANMAWVMTQAGAECDLKRVNALSPLLSSRWIAQDNTGTNKLLRQLYPNLPERVEVADIAAYEARNLLRDLAVRSVGAGCVSKTHLRIVSEDASAAMTKWVGERGHYAKRDKAVTAKTLPMRAVA